MKAPGQAAVDLRWILPCASSLVGLTRPDADSAWSEARFDPGCVLLLARVAPAFPSPAALTELPVLEEALSWLEQGSPHFIDWNQPGAARIVQVCGQQALLAQAIAAKAGCSPERAFVAGLLAPLGWLALSAVHHERLPEFVARAPLGSAWEQTHWGLDHSAITRRLARVWRLPGWLASLISNLGLHASIVEKLGADPALFRAVQLAVALVQQHDGGLNLSLGDEVESLRLALGMTVAEVDKLADDLPAPPKRTWDSPSAQPYLHDLLRLAVENRKQADAAWVNRLHAELDQLQRALEEHCRSEKERLQTLKLSALAELAAGAGHEINNPLAVISGQAQYLIKQLQVAQEMLAEETSPATLLEDLKAKFVRPLQTIVGQTQRIHLVLTDLMCFARPPAANPQVVPACALMREISESLQEAARHKQVCLVCDEAPGHWGLHVDAAQVRTALAGLLRNAIEAAPPEGWVGLRAENGDGTVKLIVEDNGPGPAPSGLDHLFDPFYSGRSAGRGRGFGLSSAWRLARLQGGEVRFDGRHQDLTRFVLSLPAAEMAAAPASAADGCADHVSENNGRPAAALVA